MEAVTQGQVRSGRIDDRTGSDRMNHQIQPELEKAKKLP